MPLSPRVVVIGSANMDLVFRTRRFPNPGETLIGTGFATYPGGKGANQAVAIGRLGGQPSFVGKLGRDLFAEQLLESLAAAGVDVSHCIRDDSPTGVAGITVDANGQNTIVVAGGANERLTPDEVESALRKLLASVLLIQQETPEATVGHALRVAKEIGMLTILNPAPARNLSPETLRQVDVLTPNESEAEALCGIQPKDAESCCQAATRLLSLGASSVLLTLGASGVYMAAGSDRSHFPAFPVTPVDTTAAGDAFNGALAHALSHGSELAAAALFANRVAALSTTKLGAQSSMPTLADVEAAG